jgi:hypothetical protein
LKSWVRKSLGEHPHQSTMCLYWHRQPSLRFQLVTLKLVLTNDWHIGPFRRTVWKKDCNQKHKLINDNIKMLIKKASTPQQYHDKIYMYMYVSSHTVTQTIHV